MFSPLVQITSKAGKKNILLIGADTKYYTRITVYNPVCVWPRGKHIISKDWTITLFQCYINKKIVLLTSFVRVTEKQTKTEKAAALCKYHILYIYTGSL